jgi:RNA polymerase-binding protein DksA
MKLPDSFLQKQKDILLAEKEKIEKKIEKLKKYPDYGQDEEDSLQELTDFESNISLEDQMEYLLNKINKALKAIEDGTYGLCTECKKNVEHGRLKIMPYAELCVSCKKDSGKKK